MKELKYTPPPNIDESNHLEEELKRISEKSFEALNELERLVEKGLALEQEK
ncbi:MULTISPECIES: hypothetical protein [Vibrio]|uniref:Uncharacterized protein n=1 Tax=Vibrio bivalvicida TaxID=1276888 RepID=A0ABV4MG32_9VIBR|nr:MULTISPECIES: hypothetical protein [Vibrio]